MLRASLRMMARCLPVWLLIGSVAQAQIALLVTDPADGVFDGSSLLGTSASVDGRIAVLGGPGINQQDPASIGQPVETFLWRGAVNVYTTNGTAWTLESVLHAADDAAADRYFGVGAVLRDKQLVVASVGALWVYERRKHGFELTDKLNLPAAASIPLFGSVQLSFENGILAFKISEQEAGAVVLIYRVDWDGHIHEVTKLTAPDDPQHLGFIGSLSLNREGDELAIGQPGQAPDTGKVYFYQPRGNSWHLTETLAAPGPEALGFGTGVALHGQKLVVGAPAENTNIIDERTFTSGVIHAYRREHGQWVHVQSIDGSTLPSAYGLAAFGVTAVTNGRFVWVTAPQDPQACASCAPGGYSNLFEWENGQLVLVQYMAFATSGGGYDMSRRYVIQGNADMQFGNDAWITDLSLVAPDVVGEDLSPQD